MNPLTQAEIDAMRSEAESSFSESCIIIRKTTSPNGKGGTSVTAVTQATYACNLCPAKDPVERESAGRITSIPGYNLTLPHDADIQPKDQVSIGGTTYEIVGVLRHGSPTLTTKATLVMVSGNSPV